MAGNNDRFTGGDELTPGTLEHAAHLAMMRNELNGGRGAYRISNAVLGASGPSYGPFQYDLGANTRARELFEQIATTAVDANGNRFISDQDLETIRSNLYQPFSDIGANATAQGAYDRLLPAINSALDSDTGRRLINQDYVVGIGTKAQSVTATIASVPDPINRTFLEQNRLAQLIILDTANQYGTSVNNGLRQLMGMNAQSEPMQMPSRRHAEQIDVNGSFGIEEMVRYKLETQYGQTDAGARDVLRRISNLVDAVGANNITLSDEDRTFLETGLRQYLVDNDRNPEMLRDPALQGLRDLGVGVDRPLRLNDTGRDVAALQENLRKLGYGSSEAIQTGTFDAATQVAVEALQRDRGLPVTGVADQAVFRAIDQSVCALQQDLNDLGYKDSRDRALKVDGDFGRGTTFALQALQRDGGLEPTGIANRDTLNEIARLLPNARTAAFSTGQVTQPAPTEQQDRGPFTPNQAPAATPAMAPRDFGNSQGVGADDAERQRIIESDRPRPRGNEIHFPAPGATLPDWQEAQPPTDPQAFTTGDPDLDRLAAALFADDDAAFDQVAAQIAQSPQVQAFEQWGRELAAAQQREELQQQEMARQQQGPAMRM